jgi:hypothetical protein
MHQMTLLTECKDNSQGGRRYCFTYIWKILIQNTLKNFPNECTFCDSVYINYINSEMYNLRHHEGDHSWETGDVF